MTTATKQADRRLVALLVIGVVCAVTLVLAGLMGCSPSEAPKDSEKKSEQTEDSNSSMDGQPVSWTMESDCATCHTKEAETMADSACPQAAAHEGLSCIQCHEDEPVLSEVHEGISFGDKPASKATVQSVPESTCESCHGTMEEMAAKTADSTALTDSNGTTVNPHDRPSTPRHDENPSTCVDCHNNHSKDLPKDAMKYCATCHHRGVFTCGNCHEIK